MRMDVDPATLTASELAEYQTVLAAEKERRERLEALAGTYLRALDALRDAASASAVVPFDSAPVWGGVPGHPPGQRVSWGGRVWQNLDPCFTAMEPVDGGGPWVDVTPVPEPEPEPEPDPDAGEGEGDGATPDAGV